MDQVRGSNKPSSSTTKVERRLVEKNRRNQMKILHSKLNSLLPNYNPKELALPLPDQVDEAINYIKSLEANVNMAKEKKERLLEGKKKRSRKYFSDLPKLSRFEIHEIGSSLQIILTCGLDNQFIFYEIIRVLHEENIDVRSINSSTVGDNSLIHVVHAEIPQSCVQFGATKVSERLKRFVNGSCSDVKMQPDELWDFEIGTDLWGLISS
ncbi:transcription factor bHLH162-like [Trifolium pratense]|uniref:Uncharacterized protein n=3 Tax=Trifolium pratense TaxID=57577 RepID=A0ACB0L6I7_TRIPR|nr:transcription factor bHLH162-like [Trifolium pratense]CAJ2642285.1 unnamed protein product [Trifolium pratense]CAJ2664999.1 unnamed protein product [Trifolium pratense]